MRAVWIDAGQEPDYEKLKRNACDAAYFDIRDQVLSPAYFADVAGHGLAVGVYAASNWAEWSNLPPTDAANAMSARLDAVAPHSDPDKPMFMLDYEGKSPGYILAWSKRWRAMRPSRVTDWTLEGHQGGLFTAGQLLILAARFRWIVPQCYDQALNPWDTYAMVADLYAHGLPFDKARPFYDAATLLPWWGTPDGFAFTQGRLP